jgi:hypothetical protein
LVSQNSTLRIYSLSLSVPTCLKRLICFDFSALPGHITSDPINWAKERDITANNSAPNKPTSNGLAERAVGIVKHMLLKHHLNYEHSCML